MAFFFAFLGAGASQPYVTDYLAQEKGLSAGQAALVLAMVYFTFAVFRFFIGFIIGAVGLHRGKILGVAAYALFPLIIWRAESFPLLLAASVIWGLGAPMLWTSSLVQVMNTAAPTRYGTSTGIVRGTVMVALFLGSYLLAYLYERRGYDALFLTATLLGLVAIVAMLTSPNRQGEGRRPSLQTFLQVMRNHEAKTVIVFLVCSGLAYGLLLNGFKLHVEEQCGVEWLKVILPVFSLAGILANFLGGRLSDRIGRWRTFSGGFAIGAVGMVLAWAFTHPLALMLAMLCIGVEFALVPLTGFAWIGDKTTPADRAAIMGYVFCFRDLGIAFSIQLRGAITGIGTALLVFAAISGLCALAALIVERSVSRRTEALA